MVVIFDSFGTLFSLDKLRGGMRKVGLRRRDVEAWMVRLLRDGFAMQAAGVPAIFRDVAASSLEAFARAEGKQPESAAVDEVVERFATLLPYEDVAPAVRRLRDGGLRVAVLSNGSVETTEALLRRAKIRDLFEDVFSAPELGGWKPATAAYLGALSRLGVGPEEAFFVAAHGWDVLGARRAGLRAAFVERIEHLPSVMAPVDVSGPTLVEVADRILATVTERSALPPSAPEGPSGDLRPGIGT